MVLNKYNSVIESLVPTISFTHSLVNCQFALVAAVALAALALFHPTASAQEPSAAAVLLLFSVALVAVAAPVVVATELGVLPVQYRLPL